MNTVGYWLFHFPNYVLAALMYSCIGRLLLSFAFPPGSDNYIWRAFVRLTDPVLWLVRLVTPAIVPSPLLLIFAVLWLLSARMALFASFVSIGTAPGVGAP